MAPDGRTDPRDRHADLDALPPDLAGESLSTAVVLLPLDPALRAIAHLLEHGRRLESWEGWVRMPDGGRAKSLTHGGSFALPRDPARAAESATGAMKRAQAHWDRNPEYPGARLYFRLNFGPADAVRAGDSAPAT